MDHKTSLVFTNIINLSPLKHILDTMKNIIIEVDVSISRKKYYNHLKW